MASTARRKSPIKGSASKESDGVRAGAVLVTGASGLLGSALVDRLLASGRSVVAVYRTQASLAAARARLQPHIAENRVFPVVADLMKTGAESRLVADLRRRHLPVAAFVHCARSRDKLKVQGVPTAQQWSEEYLLAVGVPHNLALALAADPAIGLRRVVLIGSMYGVVAVSPHLYPKGAVPAPIHYGVARAALIHLAREMAVRLAPNGVTVNAVSLGGIEGRAATDFKRRYARLCPAGRMLKVTEAVAPIEFLLSDDAEGITGQNLIVDGGWSIW
ncbi:hypothetical protein A8950_0825 [Dongia mobilis]|uniref:SDR family oxidoreductase n=1 Tax=Dongia mobilis TaxID=578943 RepID=A0A4R6WX54_9PROT|nr:hypothetical protein A8950_0825 [Dongia mobilis]